MNKHDHFNNSCRNKLNEYKKIYSIKISNPKSFLISRNGKLLKLHRYRSPQQNNVKPARKRTSVQDQNHWGMGYEINYSFKDKSSTKLIGPMISSKNSSKPCFLMETRLGWSRNFLKKKMKTTTWEWKLWG